MQFFLCVLKIIYIYFFVHILSVIQLHFPLNLLFAAALFYFYLFIFLEGDGLVSAANASHSIGWIGHVIQFHGRSSFSLSLSLHCNLGSGNWWPAEMAERGCGCLIPPPAPPGHTCPSRQQPIISAISPGLPIQHPVSQKLLLDCCSFSLSFPSSSSWNITQHQPPNTKNFTKLFRKN